jgi:hypothetical protein
MVGGKSFDISGPGECTHTGDGSIYDVPAAIWSVRQSADNRSLNVAVFRLKSGGDMITLIVSLGDKTHRISTVKIAGSGAARGSGTVRVTAASAGGTFTIDATADTGARISGTIICSGFTGPEENG